MLYKVLRTGELMTVQFENAANGELLPGDIQTIHIRRDAITLPSGDEGITEYASQGTGLGVVIIPMTVGGYRLLTRQYRHPIESHIWEFPRAIVSKVNCHEAENTLFAMTGLTATCRLLGNFTPDSNALNTNYGVYEAFIDVNPLEGRLPEITSTSYCDSEWFSEERFALHIRDSELNDAITLAALSMQSIETITTGF